MKGIMNNFGLLGVFVIVSMLASCGTSTDSAATTATTTTTGGTTTTTGGTTTTTTGNSGNLAPSVITVVSSVSAAISASSTVLVTATVKDSTGTNVKNGEKITFTSDLSGTTVTGSSLTVNGIAVATFKANNVAGTAKVTATAGSVSGFVNIDILPSTPASVTLESASPAQIGIQGSGLPEISLLTFKIIDAYGNPVTDGSVVNFSISAGLGGGETISPANSTTVGGLVSVTVTSGKKSGLLGVNATEASAGITTTGELVVIGGRGIASNFSMESQSASFEGFDRIGNTNEFTVFLADIFGNPVKEGTPITFMTEVGSIPSTSLDAAGIAVAKYTTPGGSDPGSVLKGHPLGAGTGKTGYLTVLAMAPGQEPFSDNNNNGIFDVGDSFNPALHDFGEPFVDANENGIFDVGEPYNDTNNDGTYTAPNGTHDVDTVIWNSRVVVLSTKHFTMNVIGGFPSYTVTILDDNANPVDSSGTFTSSLSFIDPYSTGKEVITGTISSGLPFNTIYALVTGNPTVPIWVPTFVNSTTTGHLDARDAQQILASTPSLTVTINGL